ncbi:phenylalanyl-tRNA synthetase alpha chain [Wickerhamomyces ciferrii]|uniref:phenylalanine--tRNA ligase n=1 Tax=Wickerhamomyces ciferrii (strain ATCC 14091 / BCRC 22168 / CBS 111 / JCM 3599 / NBRC 0793 / NRRL Y-1031 F-60-10) TaxID=1206466 RepID=K0KR45_WICCF|nr:phenylalanyl-tRNA synthetase alpha chain [Wickerhamomyces ciferrii]CCH45621.1 phenylalanyl-tRNA synthetase alpha chain [Wickerhamomyces ciferrii]
MSELQLTILKTLDSQGPIANTLETFPNKTSQEVQAALNSLLARQKITYKNIDKEQWNLTQEGQDIVSNGSHEYRLLETVLKLEHLKISEVGNVLGPAGKMGQGKAFKNGWISKNGDELIINDKLDKSNLPNDETALELKQLQDQGTLSDSKKLADLKKRKLATVSKIQSFSVEKGPEFSLEIEKLETDITSDMIINGSWENAKFKPYNFNSEGVSPDSGALHPLMKVREEFRQIFFSLGFSEMPSNQYVETGFWNFDTLFVPQQHPARDLQDTFYIKDPLVAGEPEDKKYLQNIKAVHEGDAFDSIGYRYPWNIEESLKLVLRTHSTAISSKILHDLAANPGPARLFSIDRVFRNEAVDATHLAEFHQVEGVLADYDLTLGDLIGFMEDFFSKMGVTNLKFKPTYNPYTEPSMEIFSWHEGLGKWVEIGNSGMFRPEMLEPMGLPKNLRVLGWGLSLERPTMIKYGVSNIRELLGHKVSLDFIETNPAARLDEDI